MIPKINFIIYVNCSKNFKQNNHLIYANLSFLRHYKKSFKKTIDDRVGRWCMVNEEGSR